MVTRSRLASLDLNATRLDFRLLGQGDSQDAVLEFRGYLVGSTSLRQLDGAREAAEPAFLAMPGAFVRFRRLPLTLECQLVVGVDVDLQCLKFQPRKFRLYEERLILLPTCSRRAMPST